MQPSHDHSSENPDQIGTGDDEGLLGLEIADQDGRVVRGDHRGQEVNRRRDVDKRKRRLHDRLDRMALDVAAPHELLVEVRFVQ